MPNYYDVLGVARNANNIQIQKAYHGLVKIWHPDKYKGSKLVGQKKMADINKAYETLKSEELRKKYDQENPPPVAQRQNPFFGGFGRYDAPRSNSYFPNYSDSGSDSDTGSPFNMEKFRKKLDEINESLAKSGIDINAKSDESEKEPEQPFDISKYDYLFKPNKGENVAATLNVTLEDIYKGSAKKLKIQKKMSDGKIKNETRSISLRMNTESGDIYTIKGGGNELTSDNKTAKESGDAIVNISVKEHSIYKRNGHDLLTTIEITSEQAQKGFTKKIKGIDGKMLTIKVGKLKKSSDVHIEKSKGMRKTATGKTFGDLHVNFVIIFQDASESEESDSE